MYTMESESKGAAAIIIMDYEFLAMLEALRRDVRRERMAILTAEDASEKQRHELNAYRSVQILEVLNPKRPAPQEQFNPATGPNITFVLLPSASCAAAATL